MHQSNKKKKKDEDEDISIEILSDDGSEIDAPWKAQPRVVDAEAAPGEEEEAREAYDVAWTALQAQVEEQKKENLSLKDQLLRKVAEFDNYRKRTERERSEAFRRGKKDVILEMLGVLDNFERAMTSISETAENGAFRQGIELIYKQFKDTLARLGVAPIETVGKTFDPHLHEAVMMEPTSEYPANTIITEFQKGYMLGDQMLRPAQVKVAAAE